MSRAVLCSFDLPWPSSRLMPNRRLGRSWRYSAQAKKKARSDGKLAALASINKLSRYQEFRKILSELPNMQALPIRLTFYPPDRRWRDMDSLLSSCKHHLDGAADALEINDRLFRPEINLGEVSKDNPRIQMEVMIEKN